MDFITPVIEAVSRLILFTIERFGYGGILALMTLESAGLPIPSEIVMPFSGFLTSEGSFGFWEVVATGTAGNIIGSILLYWIGVRFGRPFALAWGKYVFFRVPELERAERWFGRWGVWAIFLGRLLPAVRTYISFPAGLARMPIMPFILLTAAGSLPWVFGLTWAGAALGERWERVKRYFERLDFLIAAVALIGVGWWIWRRYKSSKFKVQS
jgi:membrane protein DedA with SNARE-associated domain